MARDKATARILAFLLAAVSFVVSFAVVGALLSGLIFGYFFEQGKRTAPSDPTNSDGAGWAVVFSIPGNAFGALIAGAWIGVTVYKRSYARLAGISN